MSHLQITDEPADKLPGAVLAVPLFEDQRPLDGPAAVVDWRLDGAITRMIVAGEISGRSGERLMIQGNGKFAVPWILLVGGGRWRTLDSAGYASLVDKMLQLSAKAGFAELALCLPPNDEMSPSDLEQMTRSAIGNVNRPPLCRLSRIARFS